MKNFVLVLGLAVGTPACLWIGDDQPDDGAGTGGGGSGSGGHGSGSGSGSGSKEGPCGETNCSPKTPGGLDFVGVSSVVSVFPNGPVDVNRHIAIGGTHEVTLEYGQTSFALPYTALSATPSQLVVEATEGPRVTLRGLGGTTYLRIVDPATQQLYDRAAYASSAFARAVPVGVEEWITSANWLDDTAHAFVFAPGHRRIGIAYLNASVPPNRLVDTSATLALDGATQLDWNQLELANASVGTHTVAITVGDAVATTEIRVTNTADSIETLVASSGLACFAAYSDGAFISGITWQFTVDGTEVEPYMILGRNCVSASSNGGTHTVTASAGGKSVTTTF